MYGAGSMSIRENLWEYVLPEEPCIRFILSDKYLRPASYMAVAE